MTQSDPDIDVRIATAVELVKYVINPVRGFPIGLYQFPDLARRSGVEASQCAGHALRVMLAGTGIDVQVVKVRGMLPDLAKKGLYNPDITNGKRQPNEDISHCVVRVGSKYYDYTARQFSTYAPVAFPMVASEAEIHTFWKEIEDDPPPSASYIDTPISLISATELSDLIGAMMVWCIHPVFMDSTLRDLKGWCGVSLTMREVRGLARPVVRNAIYPDENSNWEPLYLPDFKFWSPALNASPLDPGSCGACRAEVDWYNSHIGPKVVN